MNGSRHHRSHRRTVRGGTPVARRNALATWNTTAIALATTTVAPTYTRRPRNRIEKTIGVAADVQCPSKSVILKVGESFTCDVQMGAQKHKVLLTLTNDTGNVSWKIKD